MAHEEYYSEDGFWDKIKSVFKKLGERAICQVFALYYLLKCDRVTTTDKLLITGVLGYLIFPIDVIPDIIPGAGYTDDIAAIGGVLIKLSSYIDDDIVDQVYDAVNDFFTIDYDRVRRYVYNVKI